MAVFTMESCDGNGRRHAFIGFRPGVKMDKVEKLFG
jgi:hypothetical protein